MPDENLALLEIEASVMTEFDWEAVLLTVGQLVKQHPIDWSCSIPHTVFTSVQ
jgi:hypothetical protein